MDSSLIPNIEWFIAQIDPFNHLPKNVISQIAANIEIRYIAEGAVIAFEEQRDKRCLYLIRTGAVEQKKANGELRARLESGSVFGFSIFNPQEEEHYTALAIENSLIYQVPYAILHQILQQHPEYAEYFASDANIRLHKAAQAHLAQDQSNLFMQSVAEVANRKIAQVDAHATIQYTAEKMCQQRRSSALIMQDKQLIGIVNDRDMTKKVVAQALDVQLPITYIMTSNPPTIAADDSVLNAVSLMMQHNIRSLPVMADNQVLGILTATDLVQKNSTQSIFLINHIFQADSLPLLVNLAQKRQALFAALVNSGTHYQHIMQVMTLIADAFNQKLLMMAEHYCGVAPCRYAWLASGSQARYEIHPLSDQDNAIITERKLSFEEQRYFLRLAEFVNDGLDKCGYEKCSGGYMASNPKWCQSLAEWQQDFRHWIQNPEQEGLLNASVLLDLRVIYGASDLGTELQQFFIQLIGQNRRFLAFLTANAIRVKPPLNIFRNFVLIKDGEHKNKLNLKKRAISLLVDLGRIYALSAGIVQASSTEVRFKACYQANVINQATLDDILAAYHFVSEVRFKYQALALQQQQALTNHIVPNDLTLFERNNLKDAFRLIAKLQEAAEMRFSQKGLLR
ncbi:cyclic nucleotide-binding/CBS domain-containing protein [Testudinibacter sp. TR-2022]|uniref:DUF294 nucleotidyltransferase-like domain-containing protein n=1 Tax=Testudinibacter sp. TR-2022 TaxID=2585029 RepID=UPI00111B81B3|nr:DUF294 nucleotidyltransferase-like domain-containing protein [Testudinibacter sp. TR-2022]TNH04600.1 cyclic nucleotide-binding/CBS domain-containing protein [Pasteurellaceae bacterium Phil31]TNH09386.1 cyclic nucleotide-binding/CBS domain-containing protein [Testudinibacter sp. TR-2022]TNH09827.1 cyclic nucleotide-binding/CBS domain-containing protein [Testudinibacter sp. TR-2022]TNH13872.1 cyclic nucleotide-binding/CBS domain-containing protein [Testudinibacter sp. TR-2022]TNH20659.1 cycli